jgi:hypothetical protein
VLLVASQDASEEDLADFAADLPQARHDVLADGGPALVGLVCDWFDENG